MAKPKGDLGLAIMLGGSKKSSEDEDYEVESEEGEDSGEDKKLAKKAALVEEYESAKAEEDWEGAAKALSTFIKLCGY